MYARQVYSVRGNYGQSRIAKLLDPTLQKGSAADPEFLIDRSLVQTVMEEHYLPFVDVLAQPSTVTLQVPSSAGLDAHLRAKHNRSKLAGTGNISEVTSELDAFVTIHVDPEGDGDASKVCTDWWITNSKKFPVLFWMAVNYLAVPATSVPSERANSLAAQVYEGRETLCLAMFKATICCNSWLKALKALGVALPDDYHAFFKELVEQKKIDLDKLAVSDEVVKYMLGLE
ncbi:hypothetical protein HDU99_000225 [Rhizoclosmatium hyalinum]|nr:hypothetical protein HDU99_000225 [Rhizoclosmatium hyalinum]